MARKLCHVCGQPKSVGATGDLPCRKCSGVGSRKPRPCEVCGQTYKPTYTLQRTCGRVCGVQINSIVAAARQRPGASKVSWRRCPQGEHWYTTKGMKRCKCQAYQSVAGQVVPRTCTACGVDYQHIRRQGVVRPLCTSCNEVAEIEARRQHKRNVSRRRRARLREVARDRVPDRAIYERDQWKCGICGKRINRNAVVPHPKAPTIDHVIPLAQDGDDTASNKRAAHFICNSTRGANGGLEQLAMFG